MRWYVKLLQEDENHTFIAYSYERNNSCDGILRYNKDVENITIEKMSDGADEFATKWLFSHIHGLLGRKELTTKMRIVAIG